MTGRCDQLGLFESRASTESVAIQLDRVRLERSRRFGEVYLGWTLWQALGLDLLCAELMPEGRERVAWSTMASVLVLARLCEPASRVPHCRGLVPEHGAG